MTSSIVYEGEREVATVGILTDLRERIRMEQRLLDAQQKLQLSEKQALVAELAAAAAHELNQPLTSILGYAQLIERQSIAGATHLRAVGIIVSEAERMASIVKKIGRLTKYETTDYVGGARMLDINRATADSSPQLVMPPLDATPAPIDGDENQTGEFAAVAPAEHRRDHRARSRGRRCPEPRRLRGSRGAPRRARRRRSGWQSMTFAPPTADTQLAALHALATELPAAATEAALADVVLAAIAPLLPGRAVALRVLDMRQRELARAYVVGAPLREGLTSDGVTLSADAVARAKLKTAVAASARLVVHDRWDSPFTGIATGFAQPLAAGGELYGVIDVGYPPGADARVADEPAVRSIGGQVALALRTLRLQEDASGLRDYQARLLESANALILGIDRSWRITVCNRALLELTGSTRDQVVGHDIRDFIPADQRQYLTTAFAAALAGQHHAAITVSLPRRKGKPVRSVWTIAPVGRAGAPSGPLDGRGSPAVGSAAEWQRGCCRCGRRDRPGSIRDRSAAGASRARRAARHARRARGRRRARAQQPADLDHDLRRVSRA